MKKFVIIGCAAYDEMRDDAEVAYWSNVSGWVTDLPSATVFDEDEKGLCSLPQGGQWLDVTKELK